MTRNSGHPLLGGPEFDDLLVEIRGQ